MHFINRHTQTNTDTSGLFVYIAISITIRASAVVYSTLTAITSVAVANTADLDYATSFVVFNNLYSYANFYLSINIFKPGLLSNLYKIKFFKLILIKKSIIIE